MGSSRLPFVALALRCARLRDCRRTPSHRTYEPPAHVSYAEGIVTLERESESEEAGVGSGAAARRPAANLRRPRRRSCFQMARLWRSTSTPSVDLLDRALLRLTAGRARLTVPGADGPAAALRYQIDTPSSSVSTEGPGEYRVAVGVVPVGDGDRAVRPAWLRRDSDEPGCGARAIRRAEHCPRRTSLHPFLAASMWRATTSSTNGPTAPRRAHGLSEAPRAPRSTSPPIFGCTEGPLTATGRGSRSLTTGTVWYPSGRACRGVPTTTAPGRRSLATVGRGGDSIGGPGPRITTDGGGTGERGGSGFPVGTGDRRGSRGALRRATWAGVRSGSTIDPCSPCPISTRLRDGTDGWRCRGPVRSARRVRPPRGRASPHPRHHTVHHAGPRAGRRAARRAQRLGHRGGAARSLPSVGAPAANRGPAATIRTG